MKHLIWRRPGRDAAGPGIIRRKGKQTGRLLIRIAASVALIGATASIVHLCLIDRGFDTNEEGKITAIHQLEPEEETVYALADTGKEIKKLQTRLAELGYYTLEPTGFYGTQTIEAVRIFQLANGLPADGCAGDATREKLAGDAVTLEQYEATQLAQSDAQRAGINLVTALSYVPREGESQAQVEVWDEKQGAYVEMAEGQDYSGTVNATNPDYLVLGSECDRVAEVQQALAALNYYTGGTVSNFYGTMTEVAVCNFQKANGMNPTGICDSGTQSVLLSGGGVDFSEYLNAGGLPYSKRDETVMDLIAYARNYIGCPYVYGGAGPRVFDCSGFTMYVFRHFGYYFDHGCVVQNAALGGAQLAMSQLQPGDLVFFDTNGGHNSLEHVGIYIGGGQFIHASSGSGRVTIDSFSTSYYNTNFMWGKRVIPAE